MEQTKKQLASCHPYVVCERVDELESKLVSVNKEAINMRREILEITRRLHQLESK